MYTTAKHFSVICTILAAFNVFALLLFLLYFRSCDWDFTMIFKTALYLVTTTAISVLMAIGMRSLTQDLELEYESNAKRFKELSKKVEALENSMK